VDPSLLAELLGQPELRDLFDVEVLSALEAELQHLTSDRPARDAEDASDLLRLLGPLSADEAARRGIEAAWLTELERTRRVIRVRIAGQERWAAIEDAGRLRDALGVPLPVGVPEAFTEPVVDPLGDLMARYARTHAPFSARQPAEHFGLGVAVCIAVLERLAADRRVIRGAFRPDGSGDEWCDARVLRRLRRRTVAALRQQAEPVGPAALARLLPLWQSVGQPGERPDRRMRGVDGVLRAVEQLAGVPVPASALERLILPSRVSDYQPGMLDELTSGGEVVWAGAGALAVDDGWIALAPAAIAPFVLPEPTPLDEASPAQWALLSALERDAGLFFRSLVEHVTQAEAQRLASRVQAQGSGEPGAAAPAIDPADVLSALWDLVWAGRVTNDTYAPVRALLGSGRTAHRAKRPTPRGRYASMRFAAAVPAAAPVLPSAVAATSVGRWSRLRTAIPSADPRSRAASAQVLGEVLLDRYGIVTRGSVAAERLPGGFSAVYRVLSAFEEAGRCRRGYFVEGLGAAQFAADGAVDRLRALSGDSDQPTAARTPTVLLLAAADPANPYGAAVPWPDRLRQHGQPDATTAMSASSASTAATSSAPAPATLGHKPGRKAGALVVLVDGELVLYIERGGRTVLSWTHAPETLAGAANALAAAVRDGRVGALTVVTTDGVPVLAAGSGAAPTPVAAALSSAGFSATPQGLRLRH
jgi:ATP-dependent Lhr-like helicase